MSRDDETAEFPNVYCLHATAEALKLKFDTGETRWCPKKMVHDDSEVFDAAHNRKGKLVVPEWWAVKEGWV